MQHRSADLVYLGEAGRNQDNIIQKRSAFVSIETCTYQNLSSYCVVLFRDVQSMTWHKRGQLMTSPYWTGQSVCPLIGNMTIVLLDHHGFLGILWTLKRGSELNNRNNGFLITVHFLANIYSDRFPYQQDKMFQKGQYIQEHISEYFGSNTFLVSSQW